MIPISTRGGLGPKLLFQARPRARRLWFPAFRGSAGRLITWPHLGFALRRCSHSRQLARVAPPLPAGRPPAVDVVVAQEVPGAAAELPLRAVGLARARRLRGGHGGVSGDQGPPARSDRRTRFPGPPAPTELTRQPSPSAMFRNCWAPPPESPPPRD